MRRWHDNTVRIDRRECCNSYVDNYHKSVCFFKQHGRPKELVQSLLVVGWISVTIPGFGDFFLF